MRVIRVLRVLEPEPAQLRPEAVRLAVRVEATSGIGRGEELHNGRTHPAQAMACVNLDEQDPEGVATERWRVEILRVDPVAAFRELNACDFNSVPAHFEPTIGPPCPSRPPCLVEPLVLIEGRAVLHARFTAPLDELQNVMCHVQTLARVSRHHLADAARARCAR